MNRSNGLPDVRRRLGVLVGGKKLQIVIPDWAKKQIKSYVTEEDAREASRIIYQVIVATDVAIKAFISMVKKEGQKRGMTVITYGTCCHGKRCGTCRGIYRVHWPKFKVYVNGELADIKTSEERDFFRQLSISEEYIQQFYLIYELREVYLGISHYIEAWWEKVGLKEVNQEVEQLPAAI